MKKSFSYERRRARRSRALPMGPRAKISLVGDALRSQLGLRLVIGNWDLGVGDHTSTTFV